MGSMKEFQRPHAVCISFPAQGHINPMLKLSKPLHNKGFHITFVQTEYNHKRLLNSWGSESLKGLPDFQFKTIPDSLPPSDAANTTQRIQALLESTPKNCMVPLRNLITSPNTSNSPPVSCIISDGVMSFTLELAEEFGIPEVLFWTTSVCGFSGYLHYQHLIQKGLIPLQYESDLENGYLEAPVDWIPGMKDMRLHDLPSFIRTTDPKDMMIEFMLRETESVYRASAPIFNTFDTFEEDVLVALNTAFNPPLPPIYSVGPLQIRRSMMSRLAQYKGT